MLIEFFRSIRLTVLTIVVCVVAYTTLVLAFAALFVPEKRFGSLIKGSEGQVIGSRLVAQGFSRPEYLWPRPSAVDYNAAGAGGSNLSPTNPKIRERAETILALYSLPDGTEIPADLVATSGSGLDPHVSLEGARIQCNRIAMSRQVDDSEITALLQEYIDHRPTNPFFGSELVNVLEFNLLLDSKLKAAETR